MTTRLSHFNSSGQASMVDVSEKLISRRKAVASGLIRMRPSTFKIVRFGNAKKGDVLGVARIAGIQGAKSVSNLIPLCHPIAIDSVEIEFESDRTSNRILVRSTVVATGRTGVEMEALTAASVSLLTIYDMCKSIDKSMSIERVQLDEKSGGKSGAYTRRGYSAKRR